MKKTLLTLFAAFAVMAAQARPVVITVKDTRYQTITGFGAAACDGAMCPYGSDTNPVRLLYGPTSKIGLNIMRMEMSPNYKGDISFSDIGWDTPYDWHGSLPSAKLVKQRGGLVFATPWSPPGDLKTNGSAVGGKADDQGNVRAELREDCYEKFFPWVNTFLKYMKENGVNVDAVSVQNEPDWWVNYSGCLYTPQQQLNLVKNYAHMLDRETYNGVRLISAEPLGFDPSYSNALLTNTDARNQVDIIAGHLYGHPPLGNLKNSAALAAKWGKEVWMTEHSVTDYLEDRLPNWHEQLLFAEELNECMVAGCNAYIYWYMRAHWAFVGTGEAQYGSANRKNVLLPRAYVMSHFSKNVTGSTRIQSVAAGFSVTTEAPFETSAYIKGDSIIVMAIDTMATPMEVTLKLPYKVKSGTVLQSTGNETANLCQLTDLALAEPVTEYKYNMPERSICTFVFMIDREEESGISAPERGSAKDPSAASQWYDLTGRRLLKPHGICIERRPDGTSRKVLM